MGFEYTKKIFTSHYFRLDYSGQASPFFKEDDPTMVGEKFTFGNNTTIIPVTPIRVITQNNQPIGSVCVATCVPLYPVYGNKETTYAGDFQPFGVRIVVFPQKYIQPTVATHLGIVFSSRDIPIDASSSVNYEFSFGPGFQFMASKTNSIRFEYIYRHISNANSSQNNPGIDQGVLSIAFNHYY